MTGICFKIMGGNLNRKAALQKNPCEIMPTNLPTNALKWGGIGGDGGDAVGMGKL